MENNETTRPPSAVQMLDNATTRALTKALRDGDGYMQKHSSEMVRSRFNDNAGAAIVDLLKAWAKYADAYANEFDGSRIGDDGVLGDEWQDIGKAILGLLNGPTGALDCGTVDRLVRKIATAYGLDGDTL